MPMRWRWPPENSCGNRLPCSGLSPTRRISSATCAAPPSRYGPWIAHRLGDDRAAPSCRGFSDAYGSWKTICMLRAQRAHVARRAS